MLHSVSFKTAQHCSMVGFGSWHVVDTLLSHWILEIHRIRVDSPRPMFWDVVWLVAFGLVPLIAGWWWWREARGRARSNPSGHVVPLLLLATVTTGAGLGASAPPAGGQGLTTVVFAPGVDGAQALTAIRAAGAALAWSSPDLSKDATRSMFPMLLELT
ncbi:MAG: DUF2243 domain-containing protein [Sphingomonadaceae bacterium]